MNTGSGAVPGAHPAQPAQHLGDVGAEDAAVGVALVDHHEPQPAQEAGPARRGGAAGRGAACPGWSGRAGRAARTQSRSSRGCRRRSPPGVPGSAARRAQRPAAGRRRAPWSAPGRARVARGLGQQRGQDRQLVGERLAGGGTGRDDHVRAGVGQVGRDALVSPRRRHAAVGEPGAQVRRDPVGPAAPGRRAGPVRARRG